MKALVRDEDVMQSDHGVVDTGGQVVVKPFGESGEDPEQKEVRDHVSDDRSDEDKPDRDTWIAR